MVQGYVQQFFGVRWKLGSTVLLPSTGTERWALAAKAATAAWGWASPPIRDCPSKSCWTARSKVYPAQKVHLNGKQFPGLDSGRFRVRWAHAGPDSGRAGLQLGRWGLWQAGAWRLRHAQAARASGRPSGGQGGRVRQCGVSAQRRRGRWRSVDLGYVPQVVKKN